MFIWNIETGHRKTALWASSAPALSNVNISKYSTYALLPGLVDRSEFMLTAGNDQKIRFWDLANPRNSSLIVSAPKEPIAPSDITYESRLIDGTEVIQEIVSSNNQQSSPSIMANRNIEDLPRSGPELPSAGHHDVIKDLIMCKTQKQMFFASSSRDGVIKLWK